MIGMSPTNLVADIAKRHREELEASENLRRSLALHVHAWPDPAHALLEILQNADDAGPRPASGGVSIEFRLLEGALLVEHDGREFSATDVKALCSVGDTAKSAEKHIGFMGIGFKSVYKFASAAFLRSGPFSFCFKPENFQGDGFGWIMVPAWCDEQPAHPSGPDRTLFYFPYLTDVDACQRLEDALFLQFPAACLMFLRNIRQIRAVGREDRVRVLLRDGEKIEDRIERASTVERRSTTVFWPFRRGFEIPQECKAGSRVKESGRHLATAREVTIVFETDEGHSKLCPVTTTSSFFAFLPTKHSTRLPFIVQGDFILDAQRYFMDQNLEWNKWLLRSAAEVLWKAVREFKRRGSTRYQFFDVMPAQSVEAEEFIKDHLLETFWDKCGQEKIVPSRRGKWLTPGEAVFAEADVQELIDAPKLEQLTGRNGFVHPSVGRPQFLVDLGVATIKEPGHIIEALRDSSWLKSKDIPWFRRLYAFLRGRLRRESGERWPFLSKKELQQLPMVRTPDGDLAPPKEVLFSPQSKKDRDVLAGVPGVKLVHPELARPPARIFLQQDMGVGVADPEGVVRRGLLPEIESEAWRMWSPAEREAALGLISSCLQSKQWKCPEELRDRLALTPLPAADGQWHPAKDLYLKTAPLARLLGRATWVADPATPDWRKLVSALGVVPWPRVRVEKEGSYGYQGPTGIKRWGDYRTAVVKGEGRDHAIKSVAWLPFLDQALSSRRRPVLAELIADGWDAYYKNFMSSQHRYFYYMEREVRVDSYLLWQLKNTEWLPTTRGMRRPGPEVFLPTPELRRVAGDLGTYLKLPEKTIGDARDLWRLLQLTSELNPSAVGSALCAATEMTASERLKAQLKVVYQTVGRKLGLLAEEGKNQDDWRRVLEAVPLLSSDGHFVTERGPRVLWAEIDLKDTASEFANAITFLWYPEDIEQAVVAAFFEACGVGRLSGAASTKLDSGTLTSCEFDRAMTSKMQRRGELLWSCVAHKAPARRDEARRLFEAMEVHRCPTVSIVRSIAGIERPGQAPCFLDSTSAKLYYIPEWRDFDVALEICRVWGLGKEFAPTIRVALSQAPDAARMELESLGIAQLSLEEAEVAREPREPEPVDAEGRTSSARTEGDSQAARTGVRPVEGGFGRSWPHKNEPVDIEKREVAETPESHPLPPLIELTIRSVDYHGEGTIAPTRSLPASTASRQTRERAESRPRSPDIVGDRAEEIVYLYEADRLAGRGIDAEKLLVWASEQNRYADHDFESVDDNGSVMYIEVKAVSRDGRFRWTRNEIDLARRTRIQYWLYLVVDATTASPRIVRYCDPVALWEKGELDLDIAVADGRARIPSEVGG